MTKHLAIFSMPVMTNTTCNNKQAKEHAILQSYET